MTTASIDHITITCAALQDGADFVERMLGVRPERGGAHPRMGTHNLLLRLGETVFLEVIAPDPAAAAPGRPRWFALDALSAAAPPRLSNWVARSGDIAAAATAAGRFAALGDIEPMSRGERSWRITIPQDGSLPLDGIAPALIAWNAAPHPAATMADRGLSLEALELYHADPARVRGVLDAIGLSGPVEVKPIPADGMARLVARIRTPHGLRTLGV